MRLCFYDGVGEFSSFVTFFEGPQFISSAFLRVPEM